MINSACHISILTSTVLTILERYRWLYTLFLGIDGNFKLKRKRVSSDEQDPGLSDGWAYVVEEKALKSHLAKHWDYKQEVRSFISLFTCPILTVILPEEYVR